MAGITNFNYSLLGPLLGITPSDGLMSLPLMNRKAQLAKKAFTTPAAAAPWTTAKDPTSPLASRALDITRLKSILVDAGRPEAAAKLSEKATKDTDIKLVFGLYRALDRLQTLAKAAADETLSAPTRAKLAAAFDKGLEEVEQHVTSNRGAKISLGLGKINSSVETVKVPRETLNYKGDGVSNLRDATLANFTGTERIEIKIAKGGTTDTIVADLSTITGPVTLDKLVDTMNTAIRAVPLLNPDNTPKLDAMGNPVSKYLTSFKVEKLPNATDPNAKWGITATTVETEKVSISEATAKPTLIVTTGQTPAGKATATGIARIADPASVLDTFALATIQAADPDATEMANLIAKDEAQSAYEKAAATDPRAKYKDPAAITVMAETKPVQSVVDADGYVYTVGTTSGDLGSNRGVGDPDLFLTKTDSLGRLVWSRTLGAAASTEGSAIALDNQGNVVVAGSTSAKLGSTDVLAGRDSFVAKFNTAGDTVFVRQLDSVADDRASAIAIDATGNIFVAGEVTGTLPGAVSNGGTDGYIVRLDASGQIAARTQVGTASTDRVTAMAVDGLGRVVIGTKEGADAKVRLLDGATLADAAPTVSLGQADISAVAVDTATGRIAVGGTLSTALGVGAPANAPSGMRDGFVLQLDGAFTPGALNYIGTASTDSVDSVVFMDGKIYAGGRTAGVIEGRKAGTTDGFVARIDAASGSMEAINQFGTYENAQERVHLAASPRGSSVLSSAGLRTGFLNEPVSTKLVNQTSLREGDFFQIRVGDGTTKRIAIKADDTLETLATRVRIAAGSANIKVAVTSTKDGAALKISGKEGIPVEITAGTGDRDALAKLGLDPQRLDLPKITKGGPLVVPGGPFSLGLSDGLDITTTAHAKVSFKKVEAAIKTLQSAYRSLYWDDTKAQIASGIPAAAQGIGADSAKLQQYRTALARLGG